MPLSFDPSQPPNSLPLPPPPSPISEAPPPSPSQPPSPQAEAAIAELAARQVLRSDLAAFVYRYFSDYAIIPCWFHQTLAATLAKFMREVEERKSPRLIIEAPPRHSKSLFTTRGFVPWLLANHPKWDVIVATSSQTLANYFGKDVQRCMSDPTYAAAFPEAAPDPKTFAVDFGATVSKGQYKLVGAGTKLPGFGGKVLIADDILGGRAIAESETEMESLWSWFNGDFMNRVSPGGGVIVMNTRWAVNDITGRIMEADGKRKAGRKWTRVSFPALALHDEPHRKAGEALQPEWYTKEMLEEERDRLINSGKERDWLSLFQQTPTNETGDFFKAQHLNFHPVDTIPQANDPSVHWYLGVDFAASTKATADCRAVTPIGVHNNGFYYFAPDLYAGRESPKAFVSRIVNLAEKYNVLKIVCEKGPLDAVYAPLLKEEMARRRRYFTIEPISHPAAKYVVATPMQAMMEAHKVIWPDTLQFRTIVAPQFLNFSPSAQNQEDDIIDAAAKVFSLINTLRPPAPKVEPAPRSAVEEDRDRWKEIMKHHGGRKTADQFRKLNGDKY